MKKETEAYYDPTVAEQLKEYYKTHDFTGHIVGYDASRSTPEKDKLYAKAKKFCALSWIDQLSALGVEYSSRNYSKNYPLKLLSNANGDYISVKVADIMSDPKKFESALDWFFTLLHPSLEAGFTSLSQSLNKSLEELNDEEIHRVVDATAQLFMDEMVKALATAQQAPEIAGITKKHGAHTDFNESVSENHDKIDFIRQWEHTRTGLGALLSLDQVMEEVPDAEEGMHDVFGGDVDHESEQLLEEFRKTLDADELKLTDLLLAKKKQEDIAEVLGISQSAVSKRRTKLKEKLVAFLLK